MIWGGENIRMMLFWSMEWSKKIILLVVCSRLLLLQYYWDISRQEVFNHMQLLLPWLSLHVVIPIHCCYSIVTVCRKSVIDAVYPL